MRKLSITTLIAAGLVLSLPAHADGTYPCDEIDVRIQLHLEAAEARIKDFDQWNPGEDAPSLWDSVKDTFELWSPVPTSLDDVIEGELEEIAEKACRGGIKHVLGGIDMTTKLLKQTQIFIASQGSGVLSAMAKPAKDDYERNIQEAQAHLEWKRKHCGCETAGEDGPTVGEPDESSGDGGIIDAGTGGGLVPGPYAGGGFGDVDLTGDVNALTGTYSGTYDRGHLGTLEITYDPRTGGYTGIWSEIRIGRHGVLENIVLSEDGRTISGTWRTTIPGEGYSKASGVFQFYKR